LTDSGSEKGFLDKAKDVAGGLAEKAGPTIDKAKQTAQPAIDTHLEPFAMSSLVRLQALRLGSCRP
jgi:hypothetical protein